MEQLSGARRADLRAAHFAFSSLLLPLLLALLAASCAVERTVFEERSPYQNVFVTENARGDETVRTLRFGSRRGAIQSRAIAGRPEMLLVPYVRATVAGLTFVDGTPQRVLVIGLGGGSIPTYLHRALPESQIDVVELDPVVVRVAREWFDFVEDERLRVHVGDGRAFLEQRTGANSYDLLVLDAYGESSVPYELTTEEFLSSARRALAPSGALVANVWASPANRLYDSMLRTYQEVFDEVYVLRVPGRSNRIVVALPRGDERSGEALRAELTELSLRLEPLGVVLHLQDLVGRKEPRVTEESFSGEVLRDR